MVPILRSRRVKSPSYPDITSEGLFVWRLQDQYDRLNRKSIRDAFGISCVYNIDEYERMNGDNAERIINGRPANANAQVSL